ncbi:NAD(P)H-hydrate dehydratase, partial [Staphylococcus aureus]|uniref:NAD(P)H-hydrate dehydratase n=1 Tax=Staphylococcus aureus TaxID=1280 RepID=UPI002AC9D1AB
GVRLIRLGDDQFVSTVAKVKEDADEVNEDEQSTVSEDGTEIFFKDEDFKLTIGSPAMATGGMGDTLAGMITSFVGQFDNLKEA